MVLSQTAWHLPIAIPQDETWHHMGYTHDGRGHACPMYYPPATAAQHRPVLDQATQCGREDGAGVGGGAYRHHNLPNQEVSSQMLLSSARPGPTAWGPLWLQWPLCQLQWCVSKPRPTLASQTSQHT